MPLIALVGVYGFFCVENTDKQPILKFSEQPTEQRTIVYII